MTTVFTTYLKTKQFFYINTINMGCSNVLKLINFEVFSYDPFYHLIKSETQFWHWFPFPVIPLDLVFQPFVFPLYDVFHLGFEPDWTLLFWAFFVECRKEPFLVEKKATAKASSLSTGALQVENPIFLLLEEIISAILSLPGTITTFGTDL